MGFYKAKYKYGNVKEFCEDNGIELLEDREGWSDLNCQSKIKFKCSCGRESNKRVDGLLRGQIGCPECSNKKRSEAIKKEKYKFKNVKEFCENNGIELLEEKEGWSNLNCQRKVKLQCECGRKFSKGLNALLNGEQTNCPECSNKKRSEVLRFSVNDDFFEKIDTEEKAYWLGFIIGDGSICKKGSSKRNRVRVGLQETDREHLKKFKNAIKSDCSIYERSGAVHFEVTSAKMFSDLVKYGVIPNKSHKHFELNLDFDDKLLRHFWRGLIDADGYLGDYECPQIGLTGSMEVCSKFRDFCLKLGLGKNKIYRKGHSTYEVIYSGSSAIKLIKHFYENSNVCLDRKRKIAKKILVGDN